MNIHHLELFYYVAKHGGIMEAVRNMPYGIQQPAVSGQIIQLEDDLGVKLFQRRPFSLSAAGERLFDFVAPFFDQVDTVCDQIREGNSELLRIGAPSLVLDRYFPEMVHAVQQALPGAKLTLKEGHHHELMAQMKAGEIDLAITPIDNPEVAGFQSTFLIEIQICLLVRKDSPIRSANHFWKQDRITEALISLPPQELVSRRFQTFLEQGKLSWPPQIELSSLDLIERYVSTGLGVGLGIQTPAKQYADSVRCLPLKSIPPIRVGAVWRDTLSPAGRMIIDESLQQVAQLTGRKG